MKKELLIAVIGVSLCLIVAGFLFFPSQIARGATGCTCPTGCDTRTPIAAPFNANGVGEYCFEATELGAYIQSWGMDILQVTGVDYTNQYVVTDKMLRDTTGTYYVYYKASTANGNFSAVGSSGITNCHAAWCSNAQYGSMDFSPFTMYNNVWGASSGSQTIWANSASNWGATAEFPETSGVKSYPNASLDLSGKTLSTLGSCTSSFNVTVPSAGSYETAYDLWVPSEIMIWMNQHGAVGPIAESWNDDGTPVISAANVTVGGHTWDVYHGGSNVVSFVRQGNLNSGTVDILALLNWTKDKGWISNSSALGKFQFGFEITSAPGGLDFTTNGYSISCGGLGGGTPVTPPTPTRTPTGATPTRTFTRTPTSTSVTPTRTPTNTNTSTTPTRTPTRTNTSTTPTRTNTRTNTSTTPTRTNTRTNTPSTPTTGCQVTYTIINQWTTGFQGDVKVTNTASTAIQGWTLTWSFADGQQITSSWNATVTQSGAAVTASNPASHWNGTLAANGGSATFGFLGSYSGTNTKPTTFTLNGAVCQ